MCIRDRCTPPDLTGRRVSQVACGDRHSALLLEDGTVELFGLNDEEQCTPPDLMGRRVSQVACGQDHSALLLDDGTVELFGNNEGGQCNI